LAFGAAKTPPAAGQDALVDFKLTPLPVKATPDELLLFKALQIPLRLTIPLNGAGKRFAAVVKF
jgi:hypothetical protein